MASGIVMVVFNSFCTFIIRRWFKEAGYKCRELVEKGVLYQKEDLRHKSRVVVLGNLDNFCLIYIDKTLFSCTDTILREIKTKRVKPKIYCNEKIIEEAYINTL